jgi:hypothetical protein
VKCVGPMEGEDHLVNFEHMHAYELNVRPSKYVDIHHCVAIDIRFCRKPRRKVPARNCECWCVSDDNETADSPKVAKDSFYEKCVPLHDSVFVD